MSATAQQLTVGAIAGTNLTDDVKAGSETFPGGILPSGETQSTTLVFHGGNRQPLLGIRLELSFPGNWALEADALDREWKSAIDTLFSPPLQFPNGSSVSNGGTLTRTLTTWEFPVLLKRRLDFGRVHPFVAIGPTFNPHQTTAERNSGIFGVMLEVPFSRTRALEVDGLYRPPHGSDLEFTRFVRFAHLTWEFPVLAKYRFSGAHRFTLFLAAGPSFRAEGNLNLQSVSHFGATAAFGVEAKWRFIRTAPSVRYTRWGGDGNPAVSRKQNESG